jgi:DNA-directed RNA polymerase subunit RPC12/RpoP
VPRFENTDNAEAGGGGIPVWMSQGAEEEGATAWSRLKIALAAGMVAVVGLVVVAGWVAYRQFLRKQRITTVDTVAGNAPSSIAGGLASKEDPKPAAKEKADATTFSISIPCSRCGKVLKGNEGLIGKKVKCPHCQTMLVFQGKVG